MGCGQIPIFGFVILHESEIVHVGVEGRPEVINPACGSIDVETGVVKCISKCATYTASGAQYLRGVLGHPKNGGVGRTVGHVRNFAIGILFDDSWADACTKPENTVFELGCSRDEIYRFCGANAI